MGILKRDEENEVSGGQVFGYILLGLAALLVIAFLIFVGIKKFSGGGEGDTDATGDAVSALNNQVTYERTIEV